MIYACLGPLGGFFNKSIHTAIYFLGLQVRWSDPFKTVVFGLGILPK